MGKKFVKPAHLKAVEEGLKFRGHFQHPVGMAVHDVGRVGGVPLQPGMVFHFMPALWMESWGLETTETILIGESGPAQALCNVERKLFIKD